MYITSFTQGVEHISKGRNKKDRPIGSNVRVRLAGDDVVVRVHNTDVVVFQPDGTQIIRTGGFNSHLTRQWINGCSAAHVWSERWQLFVRVQNPEFTPSRLWKCRTCNGQRTFPYICGPSMCWAGHFPEHCTHEQTTNHQLPCRDHGRLDSHAGGEQDCYRCNGVGMCEYGRKEIHYAWSGLPLAISAEGQPIAVLNAHQHNHIDPPPFRPVRSRWNVQEISYREFEQLAADTREHHQRQVGLGRSQRSIVDEISRTIDAYEKPQITEWVTCTVCSFTTPDPVELEDHMILVHDTKEQ